MSVVVSFEFKDDVCYPCELQFYSNHLSQFTKNVLSIWNMFCFLHIWSNGVCIWSISLYLKNVFFLTLTIVNTGEGTGLLRLHSTYRHDLKIYIVQMKAVCRYISHVFFPDLLPCRNNPISILWNWPLDFPWSNLKKRFSLESQWNGCNAALHL